MYAGVRLLHQVWHVSACVGVRAYERMCDCGGPHAPTGPSGTGRPPGRGRRGGRTRGWAGRARKWAGGRALPSRGQGPGPRDGAGPPGRRCGPAGVCPTSGTGVSAWGVEGQGWVGVASCFELSPRTDGSRGSKGWRCHRVWVQLFPAAAAAPPPPLHPPRPRHDLDKVTAATENRPARRMGGARFPTCLGAWHAGRGRSSGRGTTNRRGPREGAAGRGAGAGIPRGRGSREGAGRRRTAQPMGEAGGGEGRGVGALAAARCAPRPFGPGGDRAELAAPISSSPRLHCTSLCARYTAPPPPP